MPEKTHADRRAPQRGFSLCEVMVAAAVMAISLLGLAQLLGLAFMQNQMSRYNSMAVELGRGKVEQLKSQYMRELLTGIADSELTNGNHGPETVVLVNGQVGYTDHRLNVSWTVSSVGPVRKNLRVSVVPAGVANPEASRPTVAKTVTFETALLP